MWEDEGELLGSAVVRLKKNPKKTQQSSIFFFLIFFFWGGETQTWKWFKTCSDWHFLMRRDELHRRAQPSPGPAPFALSTHSLSFSCYVSFTPSSVVSRFPPLSSFFLPMSSNRRGLLVHISA